MTTSTEPKADPEVGRVTRPERPAVRTWGLELSAAVLGILVGFAAVALFLS